MRTVLLIFGELNDEDIDWLSKTGAKQSLQQGATLIQKGVPLTSLFVVLDGEFSISIEEGREVSRAASGEILGEMSFLETRPPGATVKAAVVSNVLAVPRRELMEKMGRDSAFAARFYKALATLLSFRLRRLTYAKGLAAAEDESGDELDSNILDTVFLAGARFDRMIKRLA